MKQKKAPARRTRPRSERRDTAKGDQNLILYGFHAVKAALANPDRKVHAVYATQNAASRIENVLSARDLSPEIKSPKDLSILCGMDAVHQGIALSCAPIDPLDLEDVLEKHFLVLLDQVTDPHNVGAIMRSASALGAGGLVTTQRNSVSESGLLAKTASGALDHLPLVHVSNLSQAVTKLQDNGFYVIGLDSEGEHDLETTMAGDRIALVLGAEGSGLRRLTRERCDALARLDMPGPIKSLNVSNAAVLSLYIASRHLKI